MPKSSRPPETMSTVVAILASSAGGRNRLLVTITDDGGALSVTVDGPPTADDPLRLRNEVGCLDIEGRCRIAAAEQADGQLPVLELVGISDDAAVLLDQQHELNLVSELPYGFADDPEDTGSGSSAA